MSTAPVVAIPEPRVLVPSEMNPPLNRVLVKDEEGLHKLSGFLKRVDEFGFDLETNIVPTFVERRIRTMQFGNRDEQYVIDLLAFAGSTARLVEQGWCKPPAWVGPVLEATRPALESGNKLKVGANLEFEYVTTNWCLGLRPWHFWDCQIVEKVLNAGKVGFYEKGFWALDDMVRRYLRLLINKELQKSFDLETPLTEDQLDYAALDTRLPLAVRKGQLVMSDKLKVQRAVKVENDAIPAFGEMVVNGFNLNGQKWLALIESIEKQHVDNISMLDEFFIPVVGYAAPPDIDLSALEKRWRDEEDDRELRKQHREDFMAGRRAIKAYEKARETYQGVAAINYGAHDQLLQALVKAGFKSLRGTGKKALAKFSDKPIIQAVQAFRKTEKQLSTYGRNWVQNDDGTPGGFINPVTRRLHPNFHQMGAETGRPSCTKPNLLNQPKDKRFRSCYDAPPGYKIITTDMAGAELRILAELSGEQSWIDAFNKNWDVHSIGAQMMQEAKWDAAKGVNCQFGHDKQKCECPGHMAMRDGAKAVNFGVAYGKEAFALAEDLKISVDLAKELLATWRKVNGKVQKWLVDAGNFAKMNLFTRTFSGRIRFFEKPTWERAKELAAEDAKKYNRACLPKDINKKYGAMFGSVEREGKNTPIQGGNADIAKTWLGAGIDKDGVYFLWHILPQFDVALEDGTVKRCKMVNHVYDELVVECPEETAGECLKAVGDACKRAGAEFMKLVVMDWEGKIEDCWTK